jgi:uncharacterized ferredoxin-like protein
VEVFLPILAVVAQVEDRMVSQQAHGPLGVGVVGDMDPEGGAALTSTIKVPLDVGVDARIYYSAGEAALGEVALVVG